MSALTVVRRSTMGMLPIAVLALAAVSVAAQSPAPPTWDPNAKLVLDHLFRNGTDDHATVFMQNKAVYRAEVDRSDVELQIGTALAKDLPYVTPTRRSASATDPSTFEIYPQADGDMEIRVVGGAPGSVTHLRLYNDSTLAAAREAAAEGSGWAGGLEVQVGFHGPYHQAGNVGNPIGMVVEGCANFRAGWESWPRLSGCILGLEYHAATAGYGGTTIFIEPRVRVWGRPSQFGEAGSEIGVLGRVAGSVGTARSGNYANEPGGSYLGLGVYYAHDVMTTPHAAGWQLRVSLMHAFLESDDPRATGFEMMKFGVGRYFY